MFGRLERTEERIDKLLSIERQASACYFKLRFISQIMSRLRQQEALNQKLEKKKKENSQRFTSAHATIVASEGQCHEINMHDADESIAVDGPRSSFKQAASTHFGSGS